MADLREPIKQKGAVRPRQAAESEEELIRREERPVEQAPAAPQEREESDDPGAAEGNPS